MTRSAGQRESAGVYQDPLLTQSTHEKREVELKSTVAWVSQRLGCGVYSGQLKEFRREQHPSIGHRRRCGDSRAGGHAHGSDHYVLHLASLLPADGGGPLPLSGDLFLL